MFNIMASHGNMLEMTALCPYSPQQIMIYIELLVETQMQTLGRLLDQSLMCYRDRPNANSALDSMHMYVLILVQSV